MAGTASKPDMPSGFRLGHLRWYICGLLFLGTTINYVDRGTIAILAPKLQTTFRWTESDYGWIINAFMVAYAIMMVASGGIIDRVGTRAGYALAMGWWSLAAIGHALARGVLSFGLARFMLGAGEAGNFPASIKSVAEWFPKRERALATGIFNSGTSIGTVVAYPIVSWMYLRWGWQVAFIGTGALGFVCLIAWVALYRLPQQHAWLTPEELRHIEMREAIEPEGPKAKLPWTAILRRRPAWGFTLAKFMTDPIWWFYIFWLPKYLVGARGFTIAKLQWFGMIPFLLSVPGGVLGGWLSGYLIRRGWSVNAARKTAMLICALSMPTGIFAAFADSPWVAIALISISTAAHQGWSANVFTLASDIFPKKDVASVVGIGGCAGAVGGAIIAPVAGYTLQLTHSYIPLFIIGAALRRLGRRPAPRVGERAVTRDQ